jgi:hypothetical protein
MVALRASSADFLLQICAAVLDAVERNSQSMSNTMHAGVSHDVVKLCSSFATPFLVTTGAVYLVAG